jgi:hypothetical protein
MCRGLLLLQKGVWLLNNMAEDEVKLRPSHLTQVERICQKGVESATAVCKQKRDGQELHYCFYF